jgi:hypothetical protein
MPTISHNDVRQALSRIENNLAADPLFAGPEGPAWEPLQRQLAALPATVEELFNETLAEGPITSRYAGLLLYRELVVHYGAGSSSEHGGELVLEPGEVRCHRGNLQIGGHLRLGAGARLIATGEVFVDGSVLADDGAYSLLAVGGSLRARNIIGAGELIVGASAIIGDIIYLAGAHYGARVGELRARTVVENGDNRGAYGMFRAQQHFAERLAEVRRDRLRAIGRILGVVSASSVEQLEATIRRTAEA